MISLIPLSNNRIKKKNLGKASIFYFILEFWSAGLQQQQQIFIVI